MDGNGQTSRILSFYVLSVKLGIVLPGTPTFPELVIAHRGAYKVPSISLMTPASKVESMCHNQLPSRRDVTSRLVAMSPSIWEIQPAQRR